MKYTQYIVADFNREIAVVEKLVSNTPITLDRAVEYLKATSDFNEETDSVTFTNSPEEINLDKIEKYI